MPPFPDLAYVKFFLNAWDVLCCFFEVHCSAMKESVLAQIESRCCEELSKAAGLKVIYINLVSPFFVCFL